MDVTATRDVKLVNPQGFHLRPAHLFMKQAALFPCHVEIINGNEVLNGKSMMDLLTLRAEQGTTLTLRATGDGADAVLDALAKLFEDGFGEMAPAEEKQ